MLDLPISLASSTVATPTVKAILGTLLGSLSKNLDCAHKTFPPNRSAQIQDLVHPGKSIYPSPETHIRINSPPSQSLHPSPTGQTTPRLVESDMSVLPDPTEEELYTAVRTDLFLVRPAFRVQGGGGTVEHVYLGGGDVDCKASQRVGGRRCRQYAGQRRCGEMKNESSPC